MSGCPDPRIPVAFSDTDAAQTRYPATLWLVEAGALPPAQAPVAFFPSGGRGGHPGACPCCQPRAGAAAALGRLFQARARGEVAFFEGLRVVASPAGEAAVRAALAEDRLVRARYRLADCDR